MWVQEKIKKDGTKCYQFHERYKDPISGKQRYVTVTLSKNTSTSRKQAATALARLIDDKLCATTSDPSSLSLTRLIEKYNAYQVKTIKASTCDRNQRQMKALERILGGDTLVPAINAGYINQQFALSGEGPGRLNERLVRLKALFLWAYMNDLIADISFLNKLKPKPVPDKKKKLQTKYLEKEELAQLIDNMEIEKWKLLTQFLCLSGLRIGELIALDDKDVDKTEGGYIRITKTYSLPLKMVTSPKTESSAREVYIQPELAECIKEMRRIIRIEKIQYSHRSGIFYPDIKGGYLHYDSYRQYFGDQTEAVIGRRLTPHACRHTMTSLFAAAGVPLEAISRRLGHEDSRTTTEVYFHVTAGLKERDNEAVRKVKVL